MQTLKGLGILNIIIEIIWLLYVINECMDKKDRKSVRFLSGVYFFLVIFYLFIRAWTNDIVKAAIINHIGIAILISIIYYKNIYNAVMSFSGIYIIVTTSICIIRGITLYNVEGKTEYVITIFQICCVYFIMKKNYIIVNLYKKFKEYKYSPLIIPFSFILDYVLDIYRIYYDDSQNLIVNILLISYILFFSVGVLYFFSTKYKAEIIFELNRNLETKNSELRIIKQDHESQIDYLDCVCQSDNFQEAGLYLKNIIAEGQNYSKILENKKYKNSILNLIIRHISNPDIQVIVDERYDLSKVAMPDIEIYRVIINIVNNAVKAINGKGIIKISIYDEENNSVISIENNGPPIKKEHLNSIFEEGFTTKDNRNKSHGFGLSIVKELIEKYDGRIEVESSEKLTRFKIILDK